MLLGAAVAMIWSSLCRDAELESLVESLGRVIHPHEGEHEAENNDENVEAHDFPGHHLPPKILRCRQLLDMYVKCKEQDISYFRYFCRYLHV